MRLRPVYCHLAGASGEEELEMASINTCHGPLQYWEAPGGDVSTRRARCRQQGQRSWPGGSPWCRSGPASLRASIHTGCGEDWGSLPADTFFFVASLCSV